MRDKILPCVEMWRVIKSIGRGLRSVRPSQCCPQDCSDDGPNHYHHHNHDEVSKTHGAALRYHSVASSWSPLTLKRNYICHEGIAQTCLYHFSLTKVISEGICTGSHDSGNNAGSNSKCYYQRCPPWHWQVLQENPVLEKCYSEEYGKQNEKQNTEGWGKTCHHQEWKEILQACPTLHALGLGSAAALTWSLYSDWRKHHLFLYQAKNGQQQTPNGASIKHNLNHKDVNNQNQKSEELFQKNHRLFNNFFYSETDSQKVSSNTHSDEYYNKDCFGETDNIHNSPSHSTSISKQSVTSAESQTHETTIPVYSLQQKYLDVARKLFSTQRNWNVEEKHKIAEEIYKDDLHNINEVLLSLKDESSNRTDRTDSGCMSDLNKDFQSQTHSKNPGDQYNKNEGSDTISSVLDISLKRPVSVASELELPAEVKGGKREHSQHTTSEEKHVNSCNDAIKAKILHDMLIEIVKANHEDEMSGVVGNGGKTLTDTKPEEEVLYFQAGVLLGDPSSAFNLALCYHMGHGIKMDLEKARKLYEAASAAGHGWATYNLAVMVSQGLGGPPLPQRARSLLQQAAKMGITEAVSVLEKEEQQQSIIYEDEEPQLQRCCSELSLPSAHETWSSSDSSSDLQPLLDDDDWTVGDLCTYMDVSQKN